MVYGTPFYKEKLKEAVEKRFTSEELDFMRAMLDDEDISPMAKNKFLYMLSRAGRLTDEEIEYYAPKVNADADDVKAGGKNFEGGMRNAEKALEQAKREKANANVKQADQNLSKGGYSTSDEIIDEADPVLEILGEFYQRYQRLGEFIDMPLLDPADRYTPESDSGSGSFDRSVFTQDAESRGKTANYSHSGIEPQQLREGMNELRGIDFNAFLADAEMLRNAYNSVSSNADSLDTAWKGTEDWTGDAKASAEQVNEGISAGAEQLTKALKTVPDGISEAVKYIEAEVIGFVQSVFRDVYCEGTVAGLTVEDIDECMYFYRDFVRVLEELTGVDIALGGVDVGELHSVLGEQIATLGAFREGYEQQANQLHELAKTAVTNIDLIYSESLVGLHEALGDPFAASAAAMVEAANPIAVPGDAGTVGTSGVPGGVGGVSAGGMSGGAGGIGAGGVPGLSGATGSVEMPDVEARKPDISETAPAASDVPETGREDSEPYPVDPKLGEVGEVAGDQGRLTVEHGGHTFTMTEPGEDGGMAITVGNDDGDLRDYRLDFGADEVTDESSGGNSTDDVQDGQSDFGPRGSAAPDDSAVQVHRPGPDGKIHIKDGDIEIIAEQPQGPDGPTVVTIDNGEGDPVTYTFGDAVDGESLPEGNAGTQAAEVDGASHGGDQAVPKGTSGGGGPSVGSRPVDEGVAAASSAPPSSGPGSIPMSETVSTAAPPVDNGGEAVFDSQGSSSATHAAAAFDGGGGGFPFAGGGGELPSDPSVDREPDAQPSSPSGARLGTAPGGEGPSVGMSQGGGMAAGAGGMGMMGGMGAMGGSGGQGGDQERTSSAYRVDGNIFDIASNTIRISGTIGAADEVPIKFTR